MSLDLINNNVEIQPNMQVGNVKLTIVQIFNQMPGSHILIFCSSDIYGIKEEVRTVLRGTLRYKVTPTFIFLVP